MIKTTALAVLLPAFLVLEIAGIAEAQQAPLIAPGNLVVAVEGCGIHGGTCTSVLYGAGNGSGTSSAGGYGDNQAAPLTLFQYAPTGTASASYVNSIVFPQTSSGANFPVSGEYGSSSEGGLQLSGTGQYLTIMGYGINAPTFDAAYYTGSADPYGAAPSGALAQSGSLTGQSYTPVPRVVALVDANGNVNSSTAVYNVFNTNNPRSIYTSDGITNAYISGQGSGCDFTGGVFYIPIGVTTTAPAAITGADATATATCLASGSPANVNQDTRAVQIYDNKLYVSVDSTEGKSFNRGFIGTLGSPPATTLYVPSPTNDPYSTGPNMLAGFGNTGGTGKETMTGGIGNNLNAGLQINLSPVNYFFANASTLYVADSGHPKNTSATSSLGDGGLQKWVNVSGTWTLEYTLYQGLNLVANTSASGTTGLYGLAGVVVGSGPTATVQLYATNYTINDLDPTYLYGITDTLTNTTPPGTSLAFTLLDTAPADSNFKGVSFAPVTPAGDVEITSSPSGLTFTSAGSGCAAGAYTTPQTLSWTPSSTCTLSVTSPQTALGVTYGLLHWEDGATGATHTVTAPASTSTSIYTYSATFAAQSAPTVSWATPAAITFGGALSGIELDATAGAPGAFIYTPPAGTILPVGNQTLSVFYTPTDTVTTTSGSTTIAVNPAPPPATPVNLVVTNQLARIGGNVVVTLSIANTGGTAANNVTLSTLSIGGTAGTPLPQSVGTIAAGSSAKVAVTVPGSVGASGAASTISLSGSYTGGSFNSGGRVKLP